MGTSDSTGLPERIVPDAIRKRFVAKFLLSFVAVLLLTATLGTFFYGDAMATLDSQVDRQIETTAHLQSEELSNWIDGFRRETRMRARAEVYQSGSPSDIGLHLSQEAKNLRSDVVAVHYVDASNGTIMESTNPSTVGTNLGDEGARWVTDNLETVDTRTDAHNFVYVAKHPYESPVDGETVLSFVTAPQKNTAHLVVVEANLTAETNGFSQTFSDSHTTIRGPDGQPLGVDGSGGEGGASGSDDYLSGTASVPATGWTLQTNVPRNVAMQVSSDVGKSFLLYAGVSLLAVGLVAAVVGYRTRRTLADLTDKAERVEAGELDDEIRSSRIDEFGRLYDAFDSARVAIRDRIREANSASKEARVARSEAEEMARYLEQRAGAYSEVMEECAQGDLTLRLEREGQNEAIDRIAAAYNDMVAELEKTVGQLQTFSGDVAEAGEEVEESAGAVRQAAEGIAESVQQISVDAYDRRDTLEDVSQRIDRLSETLNSVATDVDHPELDEARAQLASAATDLEEAAAATEDTLEETENVAGAAQEQAAELTQVSDRANSLRRYARPLGDVLDRFETENEHEFVFAVGPRGDPGNGDGTGPSSPPEHREN